MKNLSLLFIAFLFLQFTTPAQQGWFEQTSGTTEKLYSVHFINELTGWAIGDWGRIFNTTDGGEHWSMQSIELEYGLAIFFIDSNTGWAFGILDTFLKTTNGGIDWIEKPIIPNTYRDAFFIDENIGWVIGPGKLLKTIDGGESWIELPEGGGFGLYFIDSNVGWIVDIFPPYTGGFIQKTTDGGLTFVQQSGAAIKDICFIDVNTGWALGRNGKILHTTNGGEEWNVGWIDTSNPNLGAIDFIDENFGWAVGYSIWHTTNGGEEWNEQESGVSENLSSVCFIDINTGWAVGANGTILKYQGTTSIDSQEIDEMPTNYSLTNNFPNPFNPSTKIKYSVPQSSNVIIKVFDILGNEIETLVNEVKPVGAYEITWYAENLPSGIYFYRLQAGDFIETKKMVLMK